MKKMNWMPILLIFMLVFGCSSQARMESGQSPSAMPTGIALPKEARNMNANPPSPSRPAPPTVEPILHNNIRYQEDMQSYHFGGDQRGGYLVAIDLKTNKRLWMLKVYTVPEHSAAGVSTPGRYFKRMRLVPGRDEIEIVNEVGGKYVVDLATQTSRWISGPDSEHQ